jgi:hypothetical protein
VNFRTVLYFAISKQDGPKGAQTILFFVFYRQAAADRASKAR